MTGNQTLIARAVISIAAGAAGIILVANRRLRALPTATFDRLLTYVFAATRLGLFVTLFLILRINPAATSPPSTSSTPSQSLTASSPTATSNPPTPPSTPTSMPPSSISGAALSASCCSPSLPKSPWSPSG